MERSLESGRGLALHASGIAVARAADAALLCIEMGRTRIASAQRTNN